MSLQKSYANFGPQQGRSQAILAFNMPSCDKRHSTLQNIGNKDLQTLVSTSPRHFVEGSCAGRIALLKLNPRNNNSFRILGNRLYTQYQGNPNKRKSTYAPISLSSWASRERTRFVRPALSLLRDHRLCRQARSHGMTEQNLTTPQSSTAEWKGPPGLGCVGLRLRLRVVRVVH